MEDVAKESASTQQLLDRVFKDPKTKYHLDLFTKQEKNRLQMFERKGKVRIHCMVRGRDFVAKPEEVVRQLMLIHLHYTLGYDIDQLAVEVQVQMGSGVHEKAADIVVYRDPQKLIHYIIVEVKKPGRKDGREQLHSYMNATGAPLGMWTNGKDVAYEFRREPNLFGDLRRLPRVDETEDDVREPIRKHMLKPVEDVEGIGDLVELVKRLQEEVLANAGVNVLEEVFKLFFAKMWDEESASDNPDSPRSICRFRATGQPPEEQMKRFQQLLDEAITNHPGIFPEGTKWELSPEAMLVVASVLERVRLSDTDMELMDHAFEYLLAPESKGDKGQYFTPRQVVKMAVKMLNPQHDERMLDPACGPCGFLIHALLHVRDTYFRVEFPKNWDMQSQNYGKVHLYAVDFDPRVERVARFMMWVAGDGSANVFRMNSLDEREWKRDKRFQDEVAAGGFDVIMTNPPFAGTIRHPQILTQYDLAYKERLVRRRSQETVEVHRDRKRQNTMTRDVLFLERCLKWLKPGGRLAIVLPQGNFNNVSAEYIRREIMRRARILAVVGLHVNSFKPHTGTKTSVLFLQKWSEDEAPDWEDWYQATYDHEAAAEAYRLRVAMRDKLAKRKKPIPTELNDLKPPSDPPAPPLDYPIFFATSQRSGRDNSGQYAYLKDENGQMVKELKKVLEHDAEGDWVEVERERKKLDCDLDDIAEAFIAWAEEHNLDFFAHSPHDGRSFAEIVEGAAIDASEVWSRDLERTHRIDAEYYHPRYLELEAILARHSPKPLTEVCYVTDGNHFKVSDYFSPDGEHRYLRGQDLSDFFLSEANPVYIPKDVFDSLEPSHMKPLDVLLSIVGTIGAVGMIPPDWPVVTGSCKLAILRAHKINPYYLAAFWASKYGKFQTERNTRGTVQMGLVLDDFPYLRVPVASPVFQEEVAKLVSDAYEQRQESKRLYRQAEQLLLDELGLSDLDRSLDLFGEASVFGAFCASRIDSDFFEPKYDRLLQHLYNLGAQPVGDMAYLRQEKFCPQKGMSFSYIEISDVNLSNGLCHASEVPGEEAPDRAQQIVRTGDIVVSTVRPLRGGIALIRPNQDGFVCSSGFAVLDPLSISAEYLLVHLRLKPIRELLNRSNRASMYPAVTASDVLSLPIIVSDDSEMPVRGLIQESHQVYFRGLELLEQAKCKVEAMIESEAAYG